LAPRYYSTSTKTPETLAAEVSYKNLRKLTPCILSQFEIVSLSVRVISNKPLRNFAKQYVDAGTPLQAWRKLVEHGRFRNLAELKKTINSVDIVPVKNQDYYVFNIGGNKYRLIATVHFNAQRLFVRHVLTHQEYTTGRWKQ
jgi:mRNA interferase HigB